MYRKRIRYAAGVKPTIQQRQAPSIRKAPPVARPVISTIRMDESLVLPFTTTAMARPDILEKTYASFTQDMEFVNFKQSTLYLNVDPLPVGVDREEVVKVAKKYFGNVVVNLPEYANFTNALIWCWQQAGADPLGYFFHLEDDWILKRKVNINEARKILLFKYNCGMVNLRAYSAITDGRICLSPGLVKSHFAREVARVLDSRYNPEKQLRKRSRANMHGGKAPVGYVSVQYPNNIKLITIEDIGRSWLDSTKYERPAGEDFVVWKEKH